MALHRSDGRVFSEFEIAPRQHTYLLPRMMNAVFEAAGCHKSSLDYCAFCNGPGAFTGVRIAASTAQGIGVALNIPLVPVSTLATLAQVSIDRQGADVTMVALDARMSEVYWAIYTSDNGFARLEGSERVDAIDNVKLNSDARYGAGHGWTVGRESWHIEPSVIVDETLLPDSVSLIKLAKQAIVENKTVPADAIHINYLRNKVAEKSKKA